MPSTLADGKVLLDAFPFDSNPNLITDVNGYLMGDRSVDAWTMRSAFKQFFSNGVFGTPADAWQIAKGAEGLTVTVQPGMAVIEGAMGGIEDRTGPLTVTLDNQAAAGNLCYGIFLRYDDNADVRGLTVYARKGTAGASPEIPKPDTTSANVYELRLGYVTVPNGATDLTNATVTNEKGLAVCPYAAPFEEIDLDQIVSDAKNAANESLVKLLAEFDTYRDAIDAALSEEEATYLQGQINDIKEQLESFGIDLADEVDDATIEYESDNYPTVAKKLRVKDGGVGTDQIADGSVTQAKVVQNIFTDDTSSTASASSKVAATPKMVRDIIEAPVDYRAVMTGDINLSPKQFLNFTDTTKMNVVGFQATTDGIIAPLPCTLFVFFQWWDTSGKTAPLFYVDGEQVTLHNIRTSSSIFCIGLKAGEKFQVAGGQNLGVSVRGLDIQGV